MGETETTQKCSKTSGNVSHGHVKGDKAGKDLEGYGGRSSVGPSRSDTEQVLNGWATVLRKSPRQQGISKYKHPAQAGTDSGD